jgi:hypothetical protein
VSIGSSSSMVDCCDRACLPSGRQRLANRVDAAVKGAVPSRACPSPGTPDATNEQPWAAEIAAICKQKIGGFVFSKNTFLLGL